MKNKGALIDGVEHANQRTILEANPMPWVRYRRSRRQYAYQDFFRGRKWVWPSAIALAVLLGMAVAYVVGR